MTTEATPTPRPSGAVLSTAEGVDLVLTRHYAAPIADVWASVTEPARTALWFGTWRGEPGPGRTVEVQMGFEESAPWAATRIEVCEPPRHLAVRTEDEAGIWQLELVLTEDDAGTELRFVQHCSDTAGMGEIGPGWEWYLDCLTAAREDTDRSEFDDYYPALKEPYETLAAQAVAG